jgi:hypothetical protein
LWFVKGIGSPVRARIVGIIGDGSRLCVVADGYEASNEIPIEDWTVMP